MKPFYAPAVLGCSFRQTHASRPERRTAILSAAAGIIATGGQPV